MAGSVTQYEGFLTASAFALAPSVRYDTRNVTLGAQGNWTVFETGNQVLQATAAAGYITPTGDRWRFELGAAAGAFRYANEPASGHALARGRLHVFGNRVGSWIGATTGASLDSTTRAPFELALGAWSVRERVALVGTITTTWLGSDRHIDVSGAARWSSRRVELEGRLGLRPYVHSPGRVGDATTGAWLELAALIPLRSNIAFDLSGGTYPSDPVRRVLGAKYATAGLRIDFARREQLPALTIPPAILAAVQKHNLEASAPEARLEILSESDTHVLRVHAGSARTVELMGDFTDWKEIQLRRRGDVWELRTQIAPGVHRLNIRIDGGPWLVPTGARPEEGEFGDKVGVVVIR